MITTNIILKKPFMIQYIKKIIKYHHYIEMQALILNY